MLNRVLEFSRCALGFSNPNEGVAHNPDYIRLLRRGDLRIPAHESFLFLYYPQKSIEIRDIASGASKQNGETGSYTGAALSNYFENCAKKSLVFCKKKINKSIIPLNCAFVKVLAK